MEAPYFKNILEDSHKRDILKTKVAIEEKYIMIRIDYTQIKNIQYHIEKAI